MLREILGRSTKFLTVVVPSTTVAPAVVKSALPEQTFGANVVVRSIDITSDGHNINRKITVYIGGTPFVDHLVDMKGYGTNPLNKAEDDIVHKQHEVIKADI